MAHSPDLNLKKCIYTKLRQITQPAMAIRQKLADSEITGVSIYGKSMVIIQMFGIQIPSVLSKAY